MMCKSIICNRHGKVFVDRVVISFWVHNPQLCRRNGSKKCLQKTPQCGSFTLLRVSETSEDNVLIGSSDLGLLDGVKGFPSSESGKVLPEKCN